jgi:hypothetical protein
MRQRGWSTCTDFDHRLALSLTAGGAPVVPSYGGRGRSCHAELNHRGKRSPDLRDSETRHRGRRSEARRHRARAYEVASWASSKGGGGESSSRAGSTFHGLLGLSTRPTGRCRGGKSPARRI